MSAKVNELEAGFKRLHMTSVKGTRTNLVPRVFLGKTLAAAGHVMHQNLSA